MSQILAVPHPQRHPIKQRATQNVVRARWIDRIEVHRAHRIPGRSRSLVVHPGNPIPLRSLLYISRKSSASVPASSTAARPVVVVSRLLIRLIALHILTNHTGAVATDPLRRIRYAEERALVRVLRVAQWDSLNL